MRVSKTLAKLRAGRAVRICGLGHFIPAFMRHAAHLGFDCIWLDLEHRAMEQRELQSLLMLSHLVDIDVMVRVPLVDGAQLYRVLEDGATGMMFPLVNTPERARQIVQAVKFPPVGSRGMDGAGLDGDYYLDAGENYAEGVNRETFVVVQIETPQAVENADAIAAVDGVDGLFIGPADLTLRLRHHESELDLDAAADRVAAAAKHHGKAWGRPGDVALTAGILSKGAQLLVQGSEFMGFINELQRGRQAFDELLAGEST
jgi:2-keto-3-deoxy-L-rhamnonate aldolase RhmA